MNPGDSHAGRYGSHRRGFTLIDVLVTIAVISLLIGLMLPALSPIRETARRVVCQSSQRQLGVGMLLYSEEWQGRLLPSAFLVKDSDLGEQPWETMVLYTEVEIATHRNTAPIKVGWDGLGLLYDRLYLTVPDIFYCPSHDGEHARDRYSETWSRLDQSIYGNFQYRGSFGIERRQPRLTRLDPGTALVADGFRTQSDINHGFGSNVLFADLSVSWFSDNDGDIAKSVPSFQSSEAGSATADALTSYADLWRSFDQGRRN